VCRVHWQGHVPVGQIDLGSGPGFGNDISVDIDPQTQGLILGTSLVRTGGAPCHRMGMAYEAGRGFVAVCVNKSFCRARVSDSAGISDIPLGIRDSANGVIGRGRHLDAESVADSRDDGRRNQRPGRGRRGGGPDKRTAIAYRGHACGSFSTRDRAKITTTTTTAGRRTLDDCLSGRPYWSGVRETVVVIT
jgi:hypothetical protein